MIVRSTSSAIRAAPRDGVRLADAMGVLNPCSAMAFGFAAYVRLAVTFRLAADGRFAVVFGLAAARLAAEDRFVVVFGLATARLAAEDRFAVVFGLTADVRFAAVFGLAAEDRFAVVFGLAADVRFAVVFRLGLAAMSPPSSADTPLLCRAQSELKRAGRNPMYDELVARTHSNEELNADRI